MNNYETQQTIQRLPALDSLRGFAVLGILAMNIQSFSMPQAAYINPTAYGDFSGINKLAWLLSHVFFEAKFMAIFAMLFGAGLLIFCQRLEARGENSFPRHASRMFWLMLLGIAHGYLLWYGDILFCYAVCGLLVYSMRHWAASRLMITAILLLGISMLPNLISQATLPLFDSATLAAFSNDWAPDNATITAEINAYRGSWQAQFEQRSQITWYMQTTALLLLFVWRVSALMLIGMALYKVGVFTRARRFLLHSALGFFALGFSLVGYGLWFNFEHKFDFFHSYLLGGQFNAIGSIFVALGYIHLLLWLMQRGLAKRCFKLLANLGRMALSNYILQSLICALLFYGIGLGLFGQVERWQQWLIVFSLWLLQLMFSHYWLKAFRAGPLEWLWRKLSYLPWALKSKAN
ncbi:DUF418 domain-containing protein [Reinekea thalattae]|uniref:DUF418 domain-containing protein n=1 Tax=Reinekea thalattae TaxID=2593301 RepID=A0A5C8Z865_9GAMM|nr:DUF418 domain-containing protein [Reinekea thalattae]TXR54295.1 DUF418 domain-containing protein [Reinekea thalattae]